MKLGMLRDFSDETGFWWNEKPPKSDIGLLHLHGLLAVGRMPMGEKIYSVALVPYDLREPLRDAFGIAA